MSDDERARLLPGAFTIDDGSLDRAAEAAERARLLCGRSVYWYDGEYEGGCILPVGHKPEDRHFDGLSWFNDENEEIDEP